MGEMVEFAANGSTARGYVAAADGGSGPGVIVLQEWWGLVPQIKAVCDLLAAEGFTALAPDLYQGEMATHTEMDKAGELMTTLPPERAARDMSAAIDYLLGHDACSSSTVGVTGFCMGGLLTLRIAAIAGDRVSAAAPFYGAPLGDDSLDWSNLSAKVEGHLAASDGFFPPDACEALAAAAARHGQGCRLPHLRRHRPRLRQLGESPRQLQRGGLEHRLGPRPGTTTRQRQLAPTADPPPRRPTSSQELVTIARERDESGAWPTSRTCCATQHQDPHPGPAARSQQHQDPHPWTCRAPTSPRPAAGRTLEPAASHTTPRPAPWTCRRNRWLLPTGISGSLDLWISGPPLWTQ